MEVSNALGVLGGSAPPPRTCGLCPEDVERDVFQIPNLQVRSYISFIKTVKEKIFYMQIQASWYFSVVIKIF